MHLMHLWFYGIGHMVKDHSDNCCHLMGYTFQLASRDILDERMNEWMLNHTPAQK